MTITKNLEAAPFPKGGHFFIARELITFGLFKAFENRRSVLFPAP